VGRNRLPSPVQWTTVLAGVKGSRALDPAFAPWATIVWAMHWVLGGRTMSTPEVVPGTAPGATEGAATRPSGESREESGSETPIPQRVTWSRRADLNLRPADYESSQGKAEKTEQNQERQKRRKSKDYA
jgi:hypothetical protein